MPKQFIIKAQNLINNSRFDIYDTCPNNWSQISYAVGWWGTGISTPDYFNSCNATSQNVPNTGVGYQSDCCGGGGYAGIICTNTSFPNSDREYLQAKLSDTLKAGHKYIATMYVNLCDVSDHAIMTLGINFTSTMIQASSGTTDVISTPSPQVVSEILLSDTLNWMLVQDTFIAVGNESYITIGNFNDDSNSGSTYVGGSGTYLQGSYYYIDNVSVYDLTAMGIDEVKDKSAEIKIYPNPNSGEFSMQYAIKADAVLEITDISGTLVSKYNLPANNTKLDVRNENLTNGVYIYRVISDKITTGKFVIIR